MRLSLQEHHKQDWRVASLASDFTVLDVWRFPLELGEDISLQQFIDFSESSQRDLAEGNSLTAALFKFRGVLGKVFRWDDAPAVSKVARPIPGCTETSVRERMEHTNGAPIDSDSRNGRGGSNFALVYRDDNESLAEISNATVHALMHFGRVETAQGLWSPQMAVLVKPRGKMGHHYMSLIAPFRHHVVYPAMMRAAKNGWPAYAKRNALVSDTVAP